MAEQVVYELSLRDLFSDKIQAAESHVTHFEGRLHQFKEVALKTFESLGIGFAIFQGFEFAKQSVEDFHKLEQAQAQVKAGLESTGSAAGLSSDALTEMAEKFRSHMLYSKSEIIDLQAQLLTFGGITKTNFEAIAQATADVATRTHHGLTEMAIMMGKAFEEPAKGLNKLMRTGVEFSDEARKKIDLLMQHGNKIAAQQVMLAEINRFYGKSTEEAFNADPLARFHQKIEELQEGIGEGLTQALQAATPLLEWLVDTAKDTWHAMKDIVHWFKEAKEPIEDIAISIGGAAVAWAGYTIFANSAAIATAISNGLIVIGANVVYGLGVATEFLNAAFIASPIGWIVVGVGALTFAVKYCYDHFQTFRAILTGVWQVIKDFANFLLTPIKVLYYLGEAAANIFHPSKMLSSIQAAKDAIKSGAFDLATSFKKGYDEGMEGYVLDHPMKLVMPNQDLMKKMPKGPELNGTNGSSTNAKMPKASGTKNIKIDIKISQLIGKYEQHTTTIQESLSKMKDHVTAALLSAVNDSQIVAGQ